MRTNSDLAIGATVLLIAMLITPLMMSEYGCNMIYAIPVEAFIIALYGVLWMRWDYLDRKEKKSIYKGKLIKH